MAVLITCACGQESRWSAKKLRTGNKISGNKILCGQCGADLIVSGEPTEHVIDTMGDCDGCEMEYALADSDAEHPHQFCSADCEDIAHEEGA